jgi:dihydrofolate reductase
MIYPNLSSIVCCDANYGIGKNDKIPWLGNKDKYVKKDLKHFSKIRTNYNYLIVGSKTFSTLPCFPFTKFFVLSNDFCKVFGNYVNCKAVYEYKVGLKDFIQSEQSKLLCIGGQSIYNQLLPCSKYLYLSQWKTKNYDCNKFIDKCQINLFKEVKVYFEDDVFKISKLENESYQAN